jgi:hypothetical protein
VSVIYFGVPMATKRKPMAKPRQKESRCHEGDPSKKSRKVRKSGQSEKGSEEGAAPASIAKENQSDGKIADNRSCVTTATSGTTTATSGRTTLSPDNRTRWRPYLVSQSTSGTLANEQRKPFPL